MAVNIPASGPRGIKVTKLINLTKRRITDLKAKKG